VEKTFKGSLKMHFYGMVDKILSKDPQILVRLSEISHFALSDTSGFLVERFPLFLLEESNFK
jgi:hypothetical protein